MFFVVSQLTLPENVLYFFKRGMVSAHRAYENCSPFYDHSMSPLGNVREPTVMA